MKHLFVARHGDYDYDSMYAARLNDSGRQQMEVLGKAMKEILKGSSVYLISSTAPRALDSSEILVAQLALPVFEKSSYLWSGDDAPSDSFYRNPSLDRLMGLVNNKRSKADGLVMVTHLEVAEEFPTYFLKKELGQDEPIGEISKGQAVHFDLEQRTYQIISGRK